MQHVRGGIRSERQLQDRMPVYSRTFDDGNYVGHIDHNTGQLHGYGEYTWTQGPLKGSTYSGQWDRSLPNGEGVLQYPTGETNWGQYRDGRLHGYGSTFDPVSGKAYIGQFAGGLRNGEGALIARKHAERLDLKSLRTIGDVANAMNIDKALYRGEWRGGKRSGFGVGRFENNSYYEGQWYDDVFNGEGVFRKWNGEKYAGEFRKGIRHGRGILHFKSGTVYEGNFKDGEPFDQGRIYNPDGTKYSLVWTSKGNVKTTPLN